ncbi:hypothetical protein D3C80_1564410 [compost metagenome]
MVVQRVAQGCQTRLALRFGQIGATRYAGQALALRLYRQADRHLALLADLHRLKLYSVLGPCREGQQANDQQGK